MNEKRNIGSITKAASGTGHRYLAFSLAKNLFALPLLEVKEVIGPASITPIPQSPGYFKGVMNLRGQIISIIDLRSKLQLPQIDSGPETSIIILDLNPCCLGIIVDSIESVLSVDENDISPASEIAQAKSIALTGIAKNENKLILLLDIKSSLSTEDRDIIKSSGHLAA